MNAPATRRPYPLDNDHNLAGAHHQALGELLDTHSRSRISHAVPDLATARCLEVGAGGGSITNWLAKHVGENGHVVACDVKPDRIADQPCVTVVGCDLSDVPQWPQPLAGPFDLIFTRLTLAHLPARMEVLTALVDRLAPGGTLLTEDWAAHRSNVVVAAPSCTGAEVYERYQQHTYDIFAAAGTDQTWAPGAHQLLASHGLVDVDTIIHSRYLTAGSPGLRLVTAVATQLRPQLHRRGFNDHDLDQLGDLLDHPELVVRGHPLYSTSGRRPLS